jgi:quercetin dioxygenase-like cupin family protein
VTIMTKNRKPRFITGANARVELAPWGKHWWLSEPPLTGTKLLTLVRVTMRPGTGHRFHYHPAREEIIYVVEGVAEQWVDREKRQLKAGEIAFIPKKVVHAIFNSSPRPMSFLAILSPASARGPFLVDCFDGSRGAVCGPARQLAAPRERRDSVRRAAAAKRGPLVTADPYGGACNTAQPRRQILSFLHGGRASTAAMRVRFASGAAWHPSCTAIRGRMLRHSPRRTTAQ